MKQNITLSLDKEIIHEAKIMAARQSSSISALLAQKLVQMVKKDRQYQQAKSSALTDLEQGFHFGGQPASREDIYDR